MKEATKKLDRATEIKMQAYIKVRSDQWLKQNGKIRSEGGWGEGMLKI